MFDQILFVESIKDYIRIYTKQKNIITKDKISDFEKNFQIVLSEFIVFLL